MIEKYISRNWVKGQGMVKMRSEADGKYKKYKSKDPFPNIYPALLNSSDIFDYVDATGMLEPFYENKLKSASYEAAIAGQCKYWDEDGKEHNIFLEKDGDKFTLHPNSIAFVEVEPTFRLPDYIALRFNLKISHVYRGLLLGTGPLIDPGFKGKIYIPLHNLTSNTYHFSYGEGLIWIEFTKISNNVRWDGACAGLARRGDYKEFPEGKLDKSLDDFLKKANQGGMIGSSIPDAIGDAQKSAKKASNAARLSSFWGFVSILAFAVGFAALIYSSWELQRESFKSFDEKIDFLRKENKELRDKIDEITPKIVSGEREASRKLKE